MSYHVRRTYGRPGQPTFVTFSFSTGQQPPGQPLPPGFPLGGQQAAGVNDVFMNDPFLFQLMHQLMQLQTMGVLDDEEFQRVLLMSQNDRSGPPPASENALRELPRFKVQEGDQEPGAMDCIVCMDTCKQGDECVRMPCNHVFHEACLMPWLQQHNTCPTCRATIEASTAPRRPETNTYEPPRHMRGSEGQGEGTLLGGLGSLAASAATNVWNYFFPSNQQQAQPGPANQNAPQPHGLPNAYPHGHGAGPFPFQPGTHPPHPQMPVYDQNQFPAAFGFPGAVPPGVHPHAPFHAPFHGHGRPEVESQEDADLRQAIENSLRDTRQAPARTRMQAGQRYNPHAAPRVDSETLEALTAAMTVGELKAEIEAARGSTEGCLEKEDLVRRYAECVLEAQGDANVQGGGGVQSPQTHVYPSHSQNVATAYAPGGSVGAGGQSLYPTLPQELHGTYPPPQSQPTPQRSPASTYQSSGLYPTMDDMNPPSHQITDPMAPSSPQPDRSVPLRVAPTEPYNIQNVPQHPPTGQEVGVLLRLPDGERLLQWFLPSDTPAKVLEWVERVSGYTRARHTLRFPSPFNPQGRVDVHASLEEQGITGRVMMVVEERR